MENLKLISVRVDPKDLKELDEIANQETYASRSNLINAGIRLYIAAHKMGIGGRARRFEPHFNDVVDKFEFEFHREHR